MTDGLRTERTGRLGRITLDRSGALNALTHDMARGILDSLDAWATDDAVATVAIDAAGGRAFCAGGDLPALHAAMTAGDPEPARAFWRDEYRMNARIAAYPKPVVTLMQGLVMGGGVGVGCHARHRVVGETARIALPECAVGLVPDAGGSWLLAQAPGRVGRYLGATGARMGPADAIWAGFADRMVPEDRWPDLLAALEAGDPSPVGHLAEPAGNGPLQAHRAEIDTLFTGDRAMDWRRALETADGAFSADALAALDRGCPLAVAATAPLIDAAAAAGGLREALALEYRFVHRAAAGADFVEGIRAAVIDKDRTPRWSHAALSDVTSAETLATLAPLGPAEFTP